MVDLSSTSGMGGTNHPNTPHVEMRISKRAEGATTELPGAQLQVLDANGEVAKDAAGTALEWTTAKEAYSVGQMPVGVYTLREVAAPAGYLKAADVVFRVNVDGTMEVQDGDTWKACDDGTVVMYDKQNTSKKKPSAGSKTTAKTADTAGLATAVLAVLVLISAGVLAFAVRRTRL